MRIDRDPVALKVEDDVLAAEIHDAVWLGEEESEPVQHDASLRAATPQQPAPRSKTPRED